MADRVLFISWGAPVRGREERSLEVFNEAVGLYGRMQQGGRIEAFDVVLLNPNGDVGGYIRIEATATQLAEVQEDDEFQRILVDASLVVDSLRVVDGWCNEGVARQMGLYREAVSRVPQSV
jgi:hypothetical protein